MGVTVPFRPRADRRLNFLLAVLGGLMLIQTLGPVAAQTAGSITDACTCWVPASSGPRLVFSLTLHNSSQGANWESSVVWANLTFTSVTAFNATTDLAALAADATSGVSFYNESGATGGFQSAQDIRVGTPGAWSQPVAGTFRVNVTFSGSLKLPSTTAATNIYVVIRTSGTVGNGDQWKAGLGVDQLNATWGNFPSGAFETATITADTVAPTSSVNTLSPYWGLSSPRTVTATASDSGSGVAEVGFW